MFNKSQVLFHLYLLICGFNGCYVIAIFMVNVGSKHGYMTSYFHSYFMYLLVMERIMDMRPN